MERATVIELKQYRSAGFDWTAYERRAERRLRARERREVVAAVADTVMSGMIGVCVVVCTLLFFTML